MLANTTFSKELGEWHITCRTLASRWEKLVGLLGTGGAGSPVVLIGCSSIHTFCMRYAIDVLLLSRDGMVLASRRNVLPGRIVGSRGAYYAIERRASGSEWPRHGDRLLISFGEGGKNNA